MNSKGLTQSLFTIYLICLVWIILFKMEFSFSDLPRIQSINLVPLGDSMVTNGTVDYGEVLSNVLAFVPFGILISLVWEDMSTIRRISLIFFVSLAFETLQYIFAIGASDVTDLIANTVGGIIGIGITFAASKIVKDSARTVLNVVCLLGASILIVLVAILIITNL